MLEFCFCIFQPYFPLSALFSPFKVLLLFFSLRSWKYLFVLRVQEHADWVPFSPASSLLFRRVNFFPFHILLTKNAFPQTTNSLASRQYFLLWRNQSMCYYLVAIPPLPPRYMTAPCCLPSSIEAVPPNLLFCARHLPHIFPFPLARPRSDGNPSRFP